MTEPTFGGVTASFATLGDVIIAEQGARIGFAGRRVIEQTIKQNLPSNFQTAEYLMQFGQIDILSDREHLKSIISKVLKLHKPRTEGKSEEKAEAKHAKKAVKSTKKTAKSKTNVEDKNEYASV